MGNQAAARVRTAVTSDYGNGIETRGSSREKLCVRWRGVVTAEIAGADSPLIDVRAWRRPPGTTRDVRGPPQCRGALCTISTICGRVGNRGIIDCRRRRRCCCCCCCRPDCFRGDVARYAIARRTGSWSVPRCGTVRYLALTGGGVGNKRCIGRDSNIYTRPLGAMWWRVVHALAIDRSRMFGLSATVH